MTTRASRWVYQAFAWGVALSAAALVPSTARADSPRVVLAAGNDTGLPSERPLEHAESDAHKFADVLRSLGGAHAQNVRVVDAATSGAFLDGLSWAAQRMSALGPDASIVVYFSGHGDAESLHLAGERLPLVAVEQALRVMPGRLKLLVIDACRSEDGRTKGFETTEPFSISLGAPTGPAGAVILRSASEGEAAQESSELGGGVFTHYLVSALRGAGDANDDSRVTLDEAYAYAYAHTLRRSARVAGPLQRPSAAVAVEGAGPIVLTSLARARSSLGVPPEEDVQYLVFRVPAETLEAELWSHPERSATVALPAGRYVVQRRRADRISRAEVSLPYGGVASLAASDFTAEADVQVAARGASPELVRRHELSAAYAPGYGFDAGLGHRLQLGYGFRLTSAWLLDWAVELGMTEWSTTANDVLQRWTGAAMGVSWRIGVGPTELRLTAGATLSYLWQRLERRDVERIELASYTGERESGGLAAGPVLAARFAIPLSGRVWMRTGVSAQWWLFDQSGEIGDRLWLLGDLAVQIEF